MQIQNKGGKNIAPFLDDFSVRIVKGELFKLSNIRFKQKKS